MEYEVQNVTYAGAITIFTLSGTLSRPLMCLHYNLKFRNSILNTITVPAGVWLASCLMQVDWLVVLESVATGTEMK